MDGAFEYSRNPSRELLNALQKGKRGGQCKISSVPHDPLHLGRHESCLALHSHPQKWVVQSGARNIS